MTAWFMRRAAGRPEQSVAGGLTLEEVVEAALAGFATANGPPRSAAKRIRMGALLTAMRHAARSREIAELAVRYRERGVVGFDIAGAEAGFPPTRHLDAFEYLRRESFHFTIHAGEAFGLPSIWEAIQWCGTDRLGHGVRIIDDITVPSDAEDVDQAEPAGGSRRLCARQAHPAGDVPVVQRADRRGDVDRRRIRSACCVGSCFRVTVNTDNRLMSDTSMTREMQVAGRGVRLPTGPTCSGSPSTP